MQASINNQFKNVFSFIGGIFHLFGMDESRLAKVRKIIAKRSDEDAIQEDFTHVGEDMISSMKVVDSKKELAELYICD